MSKELEKQVEQTAKPKSNVKSCMNCRWVACNHYGYERNACIHYISDNQKV